MTLLIETACVLVELYEWRLYLDNWYRNRPHAWTRVTARFKVVALKPNIIFFYLHIYRMFKKMFLKSALRVKYLNFMI